MRTEFNEPADPRGTALALNLNTLVVLCPASGDVPVKCGGGCRNYNGLCRLPHPETGSSDPEMYRVGVDCLYGSSAKAKKSR